MCQLTRHYGYYSTRSRGERKKKLPQTKPAILDAPDKRKASSTWAALIKRVYLVDPLICSRCGGEMKIVAFILDTKEINKITKHLGLPEYRAPPPIAPATLSEPHYEPFVEAE